MNIDFTGPVYPVDNYALRAFIEILNIILLSKHVIELNRRLIAQDTSPGYGKLSGYFKWMFTDDYQFILYQRTGYNSKACFKDKIFRIHFVSFVCKDRNMPDVIAN